MSHACIKKREGGCYPVISTTAVLIIFYVVDVINFNYYTYFSMIVLN